MAQFFRAPESSLKRQVAVGRCTCTIFMADVIKADTSVMLLGTIKVECADVAVLNCSACLSPLERSINASRLPVAILICSSRRL
jgi:hypothetical protein